MLLKSVQRGWSGFLFFLGIEVVSNPNDNHENQEQKVKYVLHACINAHTN
jgi:hypothetical protein